MSNEVISNMVGPEGQAIDRIYGAPASGGDATLVNKDCDVHILLVALCLLICCSLV